MAEMLNSLSMYGDGNIGTALSQSQSNASIQNAKNIAREQLLEGKGQAYMEFSGLAEMISPKLLSSGLSLDDISSVLNYAKNSLPDMPTIPSFPSMEGNLSSISAPVMRPSDLQGATELSQRGQLAEFEGPEIQNPLYEGNSALQTTDAMATDTVIDTAAEVGTEAVVGALTDGLSPVLMSALGLGGAAFGLFSFTKGITDIFGSQRASPIISQPLAQSNYTAV